MVDKLVKRVYKARDDWWLAAKLCGNMGYPYYYDIPKNLRYRYPAPGSCTLDEVSHPHLFKKHWKTPYRNSPYNIRQKEKNIGISDESNATTLVQSFPKWDESTALGR